MPTLPPWLTGALAASAGTVPGAGAAKIRLPRIVPPKKKFPRSLGTCRPVVGSMTGLPVVGSTSVGDMYTPAVTVPPDPSGTLTMGTLVSSGPLCLAPSRTPPESAGGEKRIWAGPTLLALLTRNGPAVPANGSSGRAATSPLGGGATSGGTSAIVMNESRDDWRTSIRNRLGNGPVGGTRTAGCRSAMETTSTGVVLTSTPVRLIRTSK